MNMLSFKDVEKYLMNKQVYFRKEIVNSYFETIAKANKVHNVKSVEIARINENVISFEIVIDNNFVRVYEHKTDGEFFSWIKRNFIPVSEMFNSWIKLNGCTISSKIIE